MQLQKEVKSNPKQPSCKKVCGPQECCCEKRYVTRFWENDPNHTSVKIKFAPPMDSFTITLLVQTLSITQTTESWF